MDNASRAMIMAGGVFIAIAIISVALYAYSNAKGFASANEELLSASQIQSFNRFYTAYGNPAGTFKQVKCIDAINILNRAAEDELQISQQSSKIDSSGAFPTAVGTYPLFKVNGGQTEYYVQNVRYSYVRDAEGKVFGVTIMD